jgi:hypothetical protein
MQAQVAIHIAHMSPFNSSAGSYQSANDGLGYV